jgi:predicted lipoprotein with Yx(FWY)xxD motif
MTETGAMTETEAMTETGAMTETQGASAAAALVMLHEDSALGNILVDSQGMTLYVFDRDSPDMSSCTGECLVNWPPFTVAAAGDLNAGEGVTGQLGTITREDDGTTQVTINGMPLYYYHEDAQAGDTNGQAVGEVWWVVDAAGNKITQ